MATKARQWVVPHVVDFDPQLREAFLTVESYLAALDAEIGEGGGGTDPLPPTDHGALTGLTDDDHPQYLRNTEVTAGTNVTVLPQADGTVVISAVGGISQAAADTRYVNVSGDTMTGQLTLPAGAPASALDAAPKVYIDSRKVDDLADADTVTAVPSGGEVLSYDGSTGLWVPKRFKVIDNINDLSDVDTHTILPVPGQVLAWDGTISQWRPATVTTGGGAVPSPEVISTDGSGVGLLFYGPNAPGSPTDGSLWATTRYSVDTPPPTTNPVVVAPTLTVTAPTTPTVSMSWNAVANATGYEVLVGTTVVASVAGTSTTVTQAENTTVNYVVRGTNTLGPGPSSTAKSATVPNQTPPPVTNLRLLSTSRNTLVFAWDYTPPADFSVYVVTATTGTVTIDAANKQATVSGIADSTASTATVSARDTGSLTSTTVSASGTTPAAPLPAAPPTPGSLRVTRTGYSSADLAWNASAGADSYEVSGDGTNFGSVGAALSYAWAGLAASTGYTFWCHARNAGGVSAPASVSFTTLAQIAYYTPNYETRNFGYGQENWAGLGLDYITSGIGFTTDGWAGSSFLTAVDLNANTGPYSTNPGRWIQWSSTLNYDAVYQVYALMGYPGTFNWAAYDTNGTVVSQGSLAANSWPQWVGANILQSPTGYRVAKLQTGFDAGLGSPGVFKLREWAVQVRNIASYSPVYNPA